MATENITIVSAYTLSETEQQLVITSVQESYPGSNCSFETNENIIGGLQFKIGDMMIDTSIQKKLEDMKSSLQKTVEQKVIKS